MDNASAAPSNLEDRIDLRGDGRIILYKRQGLKDPKWQARIRVPNAGGYKIISTKTGKLRDAERIAIDVYDELSQHVRMGGTLKSKTFRQVFEEWENSINFDRPSNSTGPWHSTVERVRSYALTYFGPKRIREIEATDFQLFWIWRKQNYSKRLPSNGTLGRERTAILSLFKFAVKVGHIASVPESTPPQAQFKRRPTFTKQEWNALTSKLDDWVLEGKKKSTWRDRYVARICFLVLTGTGLRVGELRKLRWGDLRPIKSDNGNFVAAEVRGKTGSREIVCQQGVGKLLNELIDLRCQELQTLWPNNPENWKPFRGDLVFCHSDGSAIKTFKRSFHSLLNFVKIPIEKDGEPRTIYSLRHLYATQRLYEDVSPFLLAKQMGTSVEMIERFYGQTVTSEAALQITKTRDKKSVSATGAIEHFNE